MTLQFRNKTMLEKKNEKKNSQIYKVIKKLVHESCLCTAIQCPWQFKIRGVHFREFTTSGMVPYGHIHHVQHIHHTHLGPQTPPKLYVLQ